MGSARLERWPNRRLTLPALLRPRFEPPQDVLSAGLDLRSEPLGVLARRRDLRLHLLLGLAAVPPDRSNGLATATGQSSAEAPAGGCAAALHLALACGGVALQTPQLSARKRLASQRLCCVGDLLPSAHLRAH